MNKEKIESETIHTWVEKYYGEILKKSEDLKTNACCATGSPPPRIREALSAVHDDVHAKFYGCGYPIPEALRGMTVLDLGCGAGRDVYVLSQLVGEEGFVHGLDMTDNQLEVARTYLDHHTTSFGYARPNVAFHKGYIEDLSAIEDESIDLIVSNCVVNLSPRKDLVLAEARRVLKKGGEFYLCDVVADRRLPPEIAHDPVLHSECLGGAMYQPDLEELARQSGFGDPRMLERAPITIQNSEVERKVAGARFFSVALRLFALEELERRCEDYGQNATYTGGIEGFDTLFRLDTHHLFERARPERVCSNTAAMLSETRFAPFFEITGETSTHFGPFSCEATLAQRAYGDIQLGSAPVAPTSSCC